MWVNTFKEKETPRLFAVFLVEGKRDTLMLTDFESFKINRIEPQDTTRFTVSGFIPHILDEGIGNLSSIDLMKTIAETSQIYYAPNKLDQQLVEEGFLLSDTLHIKKSKSYTILYKDPDDTTIE